MTSPARSAQDADPAVREEPPVDARAASRLATRHERRAMPRVEVTVAGKLLGQGRARFVSVRTVDVSTGGALIEWDADVGEPGVCVGEGVGLGLDVSARSLIPFDSIVSARVLRVDGCRAAVAFDQPQALPAGVGMFIAA